MKVVEASDVIIQVLDARDPLGSRCVDVERMVHKAGPLKRIVLLLNKIGTPFSCLLKNVCDLAFSCWVKLGSHSSTS